jgi:hypothetical protein
MNTSTTDTPRTDAAIWKLTKFASALLEHDGETCNEIHCSSHDEAECLVDLLNKKEKEVASLREELKISNNLDEHKAIRISELESYAQKLRAEIISYQAIATLAISYMTDEALAKFISELEELKTEIK